MRKVQVGADALAATAAAIAVNDFEERRMWRWRRRRRRRRGGEKPGSPGCPLNPYLQNRKQPDSGTISKPKYHRSSVPPTVRHTLRPKAKRAFAGEKRVLVEQ